jgi:threonine synthase
MQYISTRNDKINLTAAQTIIKGIADDGGLFVPKNIPQINDAFLCGLQPLSYQERACKILSLYLTDYSPEEIKNCVSNAYGKQFDHNAIAPIVKINDSQYLLELWHGPTSAFKDMALQLLPRLLITARKKSSEKKDIVILVATSGDTGKAALEGFRDIPHTKIIVFYPGSGVSAIQRRQMITQKGSNVDVIAIDGNFDDAQSGVKNIFNDKNFNTTLNNNGYELSSANSINWGRLLPQIVYYFSAYCDMVNNKAIVCGDKINCTVPTGNFGDILAGYYAKRMGLPINKLICASNSNNVLTEFFQTGVYDKNRPFIKTISPSMDILISSNLERLLYHVTKNAAKITNWMNELNLSGHYQIDKFLLTKLQQSFAADWIDETATASAIKNLYTTCHYVADPHTAVAWQTAQNYREKTADTTPMLILSTASPYKFNDSVLSALNVKITSNNDFQLLDVLKKYNTAPIPIGLTSLKTAPILHKNICKTEKMSAEIKNYLKI